MSDPGAYGAGAASDSLLAPETMAQEEEEMQVEEEEEEQEEAEFPRPREETSGLPGYDPAETRKSARDDFVMLCCHREGGRMKESEATELFEAVVRQGARQTNRHVWTKTVEMADDEAGGKRVVRIKASYTSAEQREAEELQTLRDEAQSMMALLKRAEEGHTKPCEMTKIRARGERYAVRMPADYSSALCSGAPEVMLKLWSDEANNQSIVDELRRDNLNPLLARCAMELKIVTKLANVAVGNYHSKVMGNTGGNVTRRLQEALDLSVYGNFQSDAWKHINEVETGCGTNAKKGKTGGRPKAPFESVQHADNPDKQYLPAGEELQLYKDTITDYFGRKFSRRWLFRDAVEDLISYVGLREDARPPEEDAGAWMQRSYTYTNIVKVLAKKGATKARGVNGLHAYPLRRAVPATKLILLLTSRLMAEEGLRQDDWKEAKLTAATKKGKKAHILKDQRPIVVQNQDLAVDAGLYVAELERWISATRTALNNGYRRRRVTTSVLWTSRVVAEYGRTRRSLLAMGWEDAVSFFDMIAYELQETTLRAVNCPEGIIARVLALREAMLFTIKSAGGDLPGVECNNGAGQGTMESPQLSLMPLEIKARFIAALTPGEMQWGRRGRTRAIPVKLHCDDTSYGFSGVWAKMRLELGTNCSWVSAELISAVPNGAVKSASVAAEYVGEEVVMDERFFIELPGGDDNAPQLWQQEHNKYVTVGCPEAAAVKYELTDAKAVSLEKRMLTVTSNVGVFTVHELLGLARATIAGHRSYYNRCCTFRLAASEEVTAKVKLIFKSKGFARRLARPAVLSLPWAWGGANLPNDQAYARAATLDDARRTFALDKVAPQSIALQSLWVLTLELLGYGNGLPAAQAPRVRDAKLAESAIVLQIMETMDMLGFKWQVADGAVHAEGALALRHAPLADDEDEGGGGLWASGRRRDEEEEEAGAVRVAKDAVSAARARVRERELRREAETTTAAIEAHKAAEKERRRVEAESKLTVSERFENAQAKGVRDAEAALAAAAEARKVVKPVRYNQRWSSLGLKQAMQLYAGPRRDTARGEPAYVLHTYEQMRARLGGGKVIFREADKTDYEKIVKEASTRPEFIRLWDVRAAMGLGEIESMRRANEVVTAPEGELIFDIRYARRQTVRLPGPPPGEMVYLGRTMLDMYHQPDEGAWKSRKEWERWAVQVAEKHGGANGNDEAGAVRRREAARRRVQLAMARALRDGRLPGDMRAEAEAELGSEIFDKMRRPADEQSARESDPYVRKFLEWFTKVYAPRLSGKLSRNDEAHKELMACNIGRRVEPCRPSEGCMAGDIQTVLLGKRDSEGIHMVSPASTIEDYEGRRRVFDDITLKRALDEDVKRCAETGATPLCTLLQGFEHLNNGAALRQRPTEEVEAPYCTVRAAATHPVIGIFARRADAEWGKGMAGGAIMSTIGEGTKIFSMEEWEALGITHAADWRVISAVVKIHAKIEVVLCINTDAAWFPEKLRRDRASKAAGAAVFGPSPRLFGNHMPLIYGAAFDRGTTPGRAEMAAATLALWKVVAGLRRRAQLQRASDGAAAGEGGEEGAGDDGTDVLPDLLEDEEEEIDKGATWNEVAPVAAPTMERLPNEWAVVLMMDSEGCVKMAERAWREENDDWLTDCEDADMIETFNNVRKIIKAAGGEVIIIQVPGHAKGVGGIAAVAVVDAAAKRAAELKPIEPKMLVRRSAVRLVGVTDHGRPDTPAGGCASTMGAPNRVFKETARRLHELFSRYMLIKTMEELPVGRIMLVDYAAAGLQEPKQDESTMWKKPREQLLRGVGVRGRRSGKPGGYATMLAFVDASDLAVGLEGDRCDCGEPCDMRHYLTGASKCNRCMPELERRECRKAMASISKNLLALDVSEDEEAGVCAAAIELAGERLFGDKVPERCVRRRAMPSGSSRRRC